LAWPLPRARSRFHLQGLLGGLIALAGIGVVFADQVGANVPIAALGLVIAGAVCVAEAGIIGKWIPRSDPFGTNAVAMLTVGDPPCPVARDGESQPLPGSNRHVASRSAT